MSRSKEELLDLYSHGSLDVDGQRWRLSLDPEERAYIAEIDAELLDMIEWDSPPGWSVVRKEVYSAADEASAMKILKEMEMGEIPFLFEFSPEKTKLSIFFLGEADVEFDHSDKKDDDELLLLALERLSNYSSEQDILDHCLSQEEFEKRLAELPEEEPDETDLAMIKKLPCPLVFESSLSLEEIEENFKNVDMFTEIMAALQEIKDDISNKRGAVHESSQRKRC